MNAALSLGLLLTLGCTGTVGTASEAMRETMLRFRLQAEESYTAGQPVELAFTLENVSGGPLFVLTWYTPLEGLKGDIFRVTRDGEEVAYQGRMVKRGDPRREDYVRIEPGEFASAKVDLALGYDLSIAGDYRVEFVGRVHHVAREEAGIPAVRDEHRAIDVPGDPVSFRVVAP